MSGKSAPPKTKRLRIRAEFLRAANSGKRAATPAFLLQFAGLKEDTPNAALRYGLTATKKLGNAVIRNRARRRLRALAEKILLQKAVPGDYVLVARDESLTRRFDVMEKDLIQALRKLSCLTA